MVKYVEVNKVKEKIELQVETIEKELGEKKIQLAQIEELRKQRINMIAVAQQKMEVESSLQQIWDYLNICQELLSICQYFTESLPEVEQVLLGGWVITGVSKEYQSGRKKIEQLEKIRDQIQPILDNCEDIKTIGILSSFLEEVKKETNRIITTECAYDPNYHNQTDKYEIIKNKVAVIINEQDMNECHNKVIFLICSKSEIEQSRMNHLIQTYKSLNNIEYHFSHGNEEKVIDECENEIEAHKRIQVLLEHPDVISVIKEIQNGIYKFSAEDINLGIFEEEEVEKYKKICSRVGQWENKRAILPVQRKNKTETVNRINLEKRAYENELIKKLNQYTTEMSPYLSKVDVLINNYPDTEERLNYIRKDIVTLESKKKIMEEIESVLKLGCSISKSEMADMKAYFNDPMYKEQIINRYMKNQLFREIMTARRRDEEAENENSNWYQRAENLIFLSRGSNRR